MLLELPKKCSDFGNCFCFNFFVTMTMKRPYLKVVILTQTLLFAYLLLLDHKKFVFESALSTNTFRLEVY